MKRLTLSILLLTSSAHVYSMHSDLFNNVESALKYISEDNMYKKLREPAFATLTPEQEYILQEAYTNDIEVGRAVLRTLTDCMVDLAYKQYEKKPCFLQELKNAFATKVREWRESINLSTPIEVIDKASAHRAALQQLSQEDRITMRKMQYLQNREAALAAIMKWAPIAYEVMRNARLIEEDANKDAFIAAFIDEKVGDLDGMYGLKQKKE